METMLKIKAGIMRVLSIVIIFLFAFMTVIGTYQIVTRYFFNKPSTVSEELLTYSFTWMALLASAYVFGKRDHMRMGFLADKLTGSARKALELCIDALTFALAAVVLVYGGISITRLTMIQTTASLRVPMGLYLRDRTCYRYSDHDLQRYECDPGFKKRILMRRGEVRL